MPIDIKKLKEYLYNLIPNPECELIYHNNYELLISIILSAQTTDKSVNKVTPTLFSNYPTVSSLSNASISDVEQIIKTIGLYHIKAIRIIEVAKELSKFSEIPSDFDTLVNVNGIGRKTASVFLYHAYNLQYFAVDTHVFRVCNRLGINKSTPFLVEEEMKKLLLPQDYGRMSLTLVLFGRYYCLAKNPKCVECKLDCEFKKTQKN
jgi:endonuclease-3